MAISAAEIADSVPLADAEAEADSWLPWVLRALSTLHRRPFDAALVTREFPPPHDAAVLIHAASRLGFRARAVTTAADALAALPLPALLGIGESYALL
ncbi:MAG: hypothetical protein ABIQ60_05235, partial [Burkholderiaceae bacterium]